jgi:hypothetical protein
LALCLPGHEDRNNNNKQKSRKHSCLGFSFFGHRALERGKLAMTVTVGVCTACDTADLYRDFANQVTPVRLVSLPAALVARRTVVRVLEDPLTFRPISP